MAEYVAIAEGPMACDHYERILTGLHHTHMPHLTDVGFVQYDDDREMVSLRVSPETLQPYLELALPAAFE